MPKPTVRITGDDPAEGADPGGVRSTKPGQPDKSAPLNPQATHDGETVVSGDRNDPSATRVR